MAESKNTLPLTYGKFELQGIVGGCGADTFCKEFKTQTGKLMKKLRFFVQTSEFNRVYVELTGMEQDTVRFQKYDSVTKRFDVKEVPWRNRHSFNENGYKVKGICVGLEKKVDSKGKVGNDVKYFVSLDAIDYMKEHLKDDMTVYCRGDLGYSTFEDKVYTALNISQISLVSAKNELDADSIKLVGTDEGGKEINNFNQTIIVQEVVRDEDRANAIRINGLVLTSKGSTGISYVTYNEKLGSNLRKLKPYTSILVSGHITQEVNVEEEDDGWGEGNVLSKKQSFTPIYLVTGADKETINTETYSEETIARYVASKRDFGTSSSASVEAVAKQLGADGTPWDEEDDW